MLIMESEITIKGLPRRGSDSQGVAFWDVCLRPTPLQPFVHLIQEFLATSRSIANQAGIISILQQIDYIAMMFEWLQCINESAHDGVTSDKDTPDIHLSKWHTMSSPALVCYCCRMAGVETGDSVYELRGCIVVLQCELDESIRNATILCIC